MENKNTAFNKSKDFSLRILKLSGYIKSETREYSLADQVIRCGTSIGANLAEAECAISRKDFLSKVYIALKESAEMLYWLEILYRGQIIDKKLYDSLYADCFEIKKMLSATTKTLNEEFNNEI